MHKVFKYRMQFSTWECDKVPKLQFSPSVCIMREKFVKDT